jgi:hypothetical protein
MTWRCGHHEVHAHKGQGEHCDYSCLPGHAPCTWRTQAEVSPPAGCMISIKSLRKGLVKVEGLSNCETCARDMEGCPVNTRIRASGAWQRYSRRKVTLTTGCVVHISKRET